MAAHPVICNSYFKAYSLSELVESRKALLDASVSPERLTGDQLDGVSFQFAPTSFNDVIRAIENVECAIAKHEAVLDPESTGAAKINSRFINFSTRRIE